MQAAQQVGGVTGALQQGGVGGVMQAAQQVSGMTGALQQGGAGGIMQATQQMGGMAGTLQQGMSGMTGMLQQGGVGGVTQQAMSQVGNIAHQMLPGDIVASDLGGEFALGTFSQIFTSLSGELIIIHRWLLLLLRQILQKCRRKIRHIGIYDKLVRQDEDTYIHGGYDRHIVGNILQYAV